MIYNNPLDFTEAAENAYRLQFAISPTGISYNSWSNFQRRLRQARRRAARSEGGYA